jgi:hypothetical protein
MRKRESDRRIALWSPGRPRRPSPSDQQHHGNDDQDEENEAAAAAGGEKRDQHPQIMRLPRSECCLTILPCPKRSPSSSRAASGSGSLVLKARSHAESIRLAVHDFVRITGAQAADICAGAAAAWS